MKIAIASGKGGTGKTTLATALAAHRGDKAVLLDCDVEEPNSHLFLKGETVHQEIVTTSLPVINADLCTQCGACADFCEYGAISDAGTRMMLFPEMCHSCGGCKRVCPEKAITKGSRRIGIIEEKRTERLTYFVGRIDVGVPLVPPLIHALKKIDCGDRHVILDAPPGTSCPVVATLQGVDYVIMVTEPTPFGLHDLKLALAVARVMKLRFGVVINRVTTKDSPTHQLCREDNIEILAEIPQDREIAENYATGKIFCETIPRYKDMVNALAERIFL